VQIGLTLALFSSGIGDRLCLCRYRNQKY
jgi:hypothetical protein